MNNEIRLKRISELEPKTRILSALRPLDVNCPEGRTWKFNEVYLAWKKKDELEEELHMHGGTN